MSISVGTITTLNRVFLAPMSGVSDEPFRRLAHECGAGLVVSEMVASEELVKERHDVVRRAKSSSRLFPYAIQLAGRVAHWMSEGARIAQDLGADLIDINMGCPARQVTGGLSGSALMRDLDHALRLVEATVSAVCVPVTLKMRLGWDDAHLNAPELAQRAEQAGVKLITVHGRTRCQFYRGNADWEAIARVKKCVKIPVIANGDVATLEDAQKILKVSGADGLMVGRAAYGRPWWPGVLARGLASGTMTSLPLLNEEATMVSAHYRSMLEHYGLELGNRMARKHHGWVIMRLMERHLISSEEAREWRCKLQQSTDNKAVARSLGELYESCGNAVHA